MPGSAACAGRRRQPLEELVEAVKAFVHAFLHARLDHGVAGLDRLVDGVVPHERPAVALDELEGLERDMARCTLELERLEHPLLGLRTVEDAVEAVGVLRVAVDEPPPATVAGLP